MQAARVQAARLQLAVRRLQGSCCRLHTAGCRVAGLEAARVQVGAKGGGAQCTARKGYNVVVCGVEIGTSTVFWHGPPIPLVSDSSEAEKPHIRRGVAGFASWPKSRYVQPIRIYMVGGHQRHQTI